jgi:hypothetical protein
MNDEKLTPVDVFLNDMIHHQQARLLAHARRIIPHATSDDILQPNDFPELETNGDFRYEEGFLAALLAVQMAWRAQLRCNAIEHSASS